MHDLHNVVDETVVNRKSELDGLPRTTRDEVLKRMLKMKPKPHKVGKSQPKRQTPKKEQVKG